MLWHEAIRLGSRQEQSHGRINCTAISPLRQRMIDDMRMRKLSPKDAEPLHSRGAAVDRLSRPLARHGHG